MSTETPNASIYIHILSILTKKNNIIDKIDQIVYFSHAQIYLAQWKVK